MTLQRVSTDLVITILVSIRCAVRNVSNHSRFLLSSCVVYTGHPSACCIILCGVVSLLLPASSHFLSPSSASTCALSLSLPLSLLCYFILSCPGPRSASEEPLPPPFLSHHAPQTRRGYVCCWKHPWLVTHVGLVRLTFVPRTYSKCDLSNLITLK